MALVNEFQEPIDGGNIVIQPHPAGWLVRPDGLSACPIHNFLGAGHQLQRIGARTGKVPGRRVESIPCDRPALRGAPAQCPLREVKTWCCSKRQPDVDRVDDNTPHRQLYDGGQGLADQSEPTTLGLPDHREPVTVNGGNGIGPEGGDQSVVVHVLQPAARPLPPPSVPTPIFAGSRSRPRDGALPYLAAAELGVGVAGGTASGSPS